MRIASPGLFMYRRVMSALCQIQDWSKLRIEREIVLQGDCGVGSVVLKEKKINGQIFSICCE